jgi:tRNA(fMet)-specific endonuclease VapC
VILLDTNHVTILRMPSNERRTRLVERMTLSHDQQFGIPIVAVEETMRGWMAAIAKERLALRQVTAYRETADKTCTATPQNLPSRPRPTVGAHPRKYGCP